MKKQYQKPVASRVKFDYDSVLAASGSCKEITIWGDATRPDGDDCMDLRQGIARSGDPCKELMLN